MELIIRSIFFFLVELLKLGIFMIGLLNYKPKKHFKVFFICSISSLLIITLINLFLNDLPIFFTQNIGYFINFLVILIVIFSIDGTSKFLVTIIVYTGISLIDVILIGAIQIITKAAISDKDYIYFPINSITFILIAFCILLNKKLKTNIMFALLHFRKRYLLIILFGLIGCGFYVGLIQYFSLGLDFNMYDSFFSFGVYASGIAFIIICISLIILNDANHQYKKNSEMNQKLLDQQRLYYQTLIDKEQYTKRFRHDINNHIYCMQHLCEQKKYTELAEYLNDMQKFTTDLNLDIQTGNNIVNIIVNELYSKNKDKSIIIKWRGLIPELISISSMDLCTIFSNLLSNAIEAVSKIDDNVSKVIEADIRVLNTNIVVQIKNPIKEKINISNNRLITSKVNKEQHGFGSINVEHCVKKYNGDLQYSTTETYFIVNLVLPNIVI